MDLNNDTVSYIISAPGGGSGHFLTHFLAPSFLKNAVSSAWVDKDIFLDKDFNVEYDDRHVFTHNPNIITDKFVVKVAATNIDEYIKITYNKWIKNCGFIDTNLDIDAIDNAVMNIFDWMYNHPTDSIDTLLTHTPGDYKIKYDDVHNIDALINLYETVNSTNIPLFKKQYALSYIEEHKVIYGNYAFKATARIIKFEYSNNVYLNHIRFWDIREITEKNHDSFLDSSLDLTNYRKKEKNE